MLAPDIIRQLQAALETCTDPYDIVKAAGLLLTQTDLKVEALPHYVRGLKMLRLTAAAQRLMGEPATAAGGGLIPWSSRARRFSANIAALAKVCPEGAALVRDTAQKLKEFELHQTGDGNFEVLDVKLPLPGAWLAGLANHKLAADGFQFDASKISVPQPIAFDGLSFGWALLRIAEVTQNSFLNYSCALYVFEPDPLSIAMLFHMHDLTQLIAAPRLRWLIGNTPDDVIKQFRTAVAKSPSWSLPQSFVRCVLQNRPALPLQDVVAALRTSRDKSRQATLAAVERLYADKSTADWRKRFDAALAPKSPDPLRVMGITSRFTTVLQHSMAELQSAVRAAGVTMEVAIEPNDQSLEHPWLELIASFKPDLIVQISRMRYENPQLPRNVPFLTWDQDNLTCMRTPQATESLDALTFVAGQGALHGFAYLNWPPKNTILCHLAAATHRYQPRSPTPEESAQYACDLSYISNAAASPQVLRDQHAPRFGEGAATAFGSLCDLILANPLDPTGVPWNDGSMRAAILKIADDQKIGLPAETLQEIILSGMLVADRAFRHQTLQWASDFCRDTGKTLRIYGSGWETHPTLTPHAAGVAQAGAQFQAVTLASRINLQIIGTGVLHPRLLDGLAAGGFFMFRQTLNDRGDPQYLSALETISKHIFENNLHSFAQLDALTQPMLQNAWARISATYRQSQQSTGIEEKIVLRGMATSHLLRHPTRLLPTLAQIAFETREQFAERAAAFLKDDAARQTVAASLRRSIQDNFSYDARWKTFISHIHAAL